MAKNEVPRSYADCIVDWDEMRVDTRRYWLWLSDGETDNPDDEWIRANAKRMDEKLQPELEAAKRSGKLVNMIEWLKERGYGE